METPLSWLWLPIILSGVALFFASWLAWMVLPHHKGEWHGLPNEEGAMSALRSLNIPPGQYNFPHACSSDDMKSEDFNRRMKAGPCGFITVFGNWPNMGVNMLCTLLFFTIANFVIGYLAGSVIPPGQTFLQVFRFVGTAGILTYGTANILNGIWFGRKMVADIADGIAYGLITGLIFAALWPAAVNQILRFAQDDHCSDSSCSVPSVTSLVSRRRKIPPSRHERNTPHVVDAHPALEIIGLALIFLATSYVYKPALTGALLWDDDAHITRPDLQSPHGLFRIWFEMGATQQYYPLLHSAFWIEHQLWGDSVLGYHLVNLTLHIVSVSLLYFILKRLKIPGALLAAAIFALHPVMVESVAWISEQKNTLSAVFYLSAMLVYLEFDESRRRWQYFIALGLFVLGLLTKTVTASLPAALLLIFWWQRGTLSWRRDVVPLVPFFALGALSGAVTAWFERSLIGAEGADFEATFVQRVLLAGRVIWFYLSKLFWPANLIFFYPRWKIEPAVWWQWLFPAATLGVLVLLWMLRRKSRGPLAGWLFFCGTLFPVLGFLNVFPFVYSFVADHFQYLASLGIIVLASAGIAQAVGRLPKPARWAASAACILLLVVLGTLTSRQAGMYVDNNVLYQTTIDRNPACWNVYSNIASQLAGDGNVRAAISFYRRAIETKPDSFMVQSNLGATLASSGEFPEAIEHMQYALTLKPNYFSGHKNLARAFSVSGRLPEAIDEYRKALALRPDHPEALNSLGIILTSIGQTSEAIELFSHALRIQPDFAEACENLSKAQAIANRSNEAIESAQRAIDLARRTGQQSRAERVEEWLQHYKIELRRDVTN